ncbi:MAG: hypothetical protein MUF21_04965 [Gemmatimonadaceae bacterium]|jgi:hypothetical protein|nr:hypothetical protein [Gemmatimonadaceae bacterium]
MMHWLLQSAGDLPWFRTGLFYKNLHLYGIFVVMATLGGMAIHAVNGGTKQTTRTRALTGAMFGIGMLLVMAGGFGQAARLGLTDTSIFPLWLWLKIGIWFVVGALFSLPYRFPALARPTYFVLPLIGALAAYMAIYHVPS